MLNLPSAIMYIPHSSKIVPSDIRKQIILSDSELNDEIIRMTDSYTDELFICDAHLAYRIVFPVSRLVVDPERFVNDDEESMSKRGMGVVYQKTSKGESLRCTLSNDEKDSLIQKYYEPHHKVFTDLTETILNNCERALIIDCHSFPSKPLEYEPDKSPNRPDICIGTDSYHTPHWLTKSVIEILDNKFTWKINSPFSGAIVPKFYYHIDKRVLSIMFEINRSLYIDEISGERNDRFVQLQSKLKTILESTIHIVSR